MSRWLGLPTSRAATRPPFHFLIPALLLSSATTAAASASASAGSSARAAAFVVSPSRPPLPIVVGQAIPAAASFLRPLRPALPRAMTITSSAAASSSSSISSSSPGATPTPTTASAAPPTKRLTLLFVRRANPETGAKEVLLGMKKRGFGQGKWNGFGGKVEPGETVEAAALRELEEESCVRAAGAELRGKITFTFLTIPDVLKVHVFEARGPFVGEPAETEEMRPQWYEEGAIPYDKMWADDKYWVPMFLEGKRFQALFEFDDESTILRYDLRTLGPEEELVCE